MGSSPCGRRVCLGGTSGKEHLLTWSYCPRRSQACSRREWGRVRVCHIFGSLKRPPFWQRVEQFDKELVPPPQAGLKFHHMGQRPGPTSCLQGALGAPVHPRASRPHWPIPALPLPGGLAARLGHCVLKRSRALVTVAKQRNACWLCPDRTWAVVSLPRLGSLATARAELPVSTLTTPISSAQDRKSVV